MMEREQRNMRSRQAAKFNGNWKDNETG